MLNLKQNLNQVKSCETKGVYTDNVKVFVFIVFLKNDISNKYTHIQKKEDDIQQTLLASLPFITCK